MDSKYQLILETVENQVGSLLIGLNNSNALDRLMVIQNIKRDIEKVEGAMKEAIDTITETIAMARIGAKKYYPDTTKERLNS